MSYTVETGIPIPPGQRTGKAKYPFPEMKVGDSFFVPAGESDGKRVGMAAFCFARDLAKKNPDDQRKFCTRTTKTQPRGVRCWRIA